MSSEPLADFDRALTALRSRAPRVWTGAPDPRALARLIEDTRATYACALPDLLAQFLARWNGFDDRASGLLWSCVGHDRGGADHCDAVDFDTFAFGELQDEGYFVLRMDGAGAEPAVYFISYSDPPPFVRISDDFESFLRAWVAADLSLLTVLHQAQR